METTSFPVSTMSLVGDGENATSLECEYTSLRALLIIPFSLITLFAVPGNLLVMLAVVREKRLQNPTNVFVVGLALSDIINGLICIPSGYFFFVSYCDDLPILYFRFLVRTCCGCSVTHLVLVSVDRYIAVAKPLRYPILLTRRRARIFSITAWVVIVVYMFVVAVLYRLNDTGVVKLNHIAFVIFWNYLPSACIVIAMVITSIIYGYVLYQTHQLRSRMNSMMRSSFQNNTRFTRRSKQLQATKTLAIVVLAFAICWLPISITLFLDKGPDYDPHISLGPTLFYYANSIMNPLIYAHRSKEFREAFKSLLYEFFCCKCGQRTRERKASTNSQSGRPSVSDKNMSFSGPDRNMSFNGPGPESHQRTNGHTVTVGPPACDIATV